MSGFHYSGVEMSMTFAATEGTFFWSNGWAWGTCTIKPEGQKFRAELQVLHGELKLKTFRLGENGEKKFKNPVILKTRERTEILI